MHKFRRFILFSMVLSMVFYSTGCWTIIKDRATGESLLAPPARRTDKSTNGSASRGKEAKCTPKKRRVVPTHPELKIAVAGFVHAKVQRYDFQRDVSGNVFDGLIITKRWKSAPGVTDLSLNLSQHLMELGYEQADYQIGAEGDLYVVGYFHIEDWPGGATDGWEAYNLASLFLTLGMCLLLPWPMHSTYGDTTMILSIYGADGTLVATKKIFAAPSAGGLGLFSGGAWKRLPPRFAEAAAYQLIIMIEDNMEKLLAAKALATAVDPANE